jgi:Zn-dependent protease
MDALILIPVLIFSIVVHEVAHAWQARREGDDTADKLGRITLNPLPHLDLWGSFLVPAALYLMGTGFLFGWAKPVPVDPSNYRDPVGGDIRVSLAGIVSNLVLAVISTLMLAVVVKIGSMTNGFGPLLDVLYVALNYSLVINLLLAFFNLVPIPPLDGSHVLAHLLPPDMARKYREFAQYGIMALLGGMYFGRFVGIDVFAIVLWPVTFFRGLADGFIRLWI